MYAPFFFVLIVEEKQKLYLNASKKILNNSNTQVEEKQKLYLNYPTPARLQQSITVEEKQKLYLNEVENGLWEGVLVS